MCKEVNMSVNNEQFRLLFIDHKFGEMALEDQLSTYNPDAVLMVMAVDDEESLATAAGMLSLMKRTEVLDKLPVILVANKTDLVRSRSIKHSDGKCLARQFNVKYIETSPGKYTIQTWTNQMRHYSSRPSRVVLHLVPVCMYIYRVMIIKKCHNSVRDNR